MNKPQPPKETPDSLSGARITGYTSGVFDLLHEGHINYLKQCKSLCNTLIIGVDEDSLVKKNKGTNRPFESIEKRINKILSLELADEVFIKKTTSNELLKTIRPNKYFIPNNRVLDRSRHNLLAEMSIELIAITYTDGISTSIISQQSYSADQ